MKNNFVSIGIDISKDFLDICGLGKNFPERISNNINDITKLVDHLLKTRPDLILCEASGGYERLLHMIIEQSGLSLAIVNARQIRDFAKAKGVLAKTDKLDAKIIAQYGELFKPQAKQISRSQELTGYVNRRKQLVEMLKLEKQHLSKICDFRIKDECEQHIDIIKQRIEMLEAKIIAYIEDNQELSEKYQIITSCKGVGIVTASELIVNMPELGTANHSEIAALAGLAPFNCDSGNMRGMRRIKGGRGEVRKALYMATISAISNNNQDIKRFYDKLKQKGKASKVAIVACMRKLLIMLNSMLRDNRKWTQEYQVKSV